MARHPGLDGWFGELRRTGRLRRDERAEQTLELVLDVLSALPAEPPTTRARLAVELCGGAHALDGDRGRLVADALAFLSGEPQPVSDDGRRGVWAGAGVEIEPVRSRVGVLGLRPHPVGPLTQAAGLWADSGVPLVLHLGAVTAETWSVGARTVFVCENPAVLEEAARALGADCPPLVCVEGQLSVGASRLLAQLHGGGAHLVYHGDFGAGGITIANRVVGRLGARPWRMGVADLDRALARARREGLTLPALRGAVPDACWDVALSDAVRAAGVEVEEELVVADLLADLAAGRLGTSAVAPFGR